MTGKVERLNKWRYNRTLKELLDDVADFDDKIVGEGRQVTGAVVIWIEDREDDIRTLDYHGFGLTTYELLGLAELFKNKVLNRSNVDG